MECLSHLWHLRLLSYYDTSLACSSKISCSNKTNILRQFLVEVKCLEKGSAFFLIHTVTSGLVADLRDGKLIWHQGRASPCVVQWYGVIGMV